MSRYHGSWMGLICAVLCVGCIDPPPLLEVSLDVGPDVGVDLGVDVGPDTCVPRDETCNGLDDDCDGSADEQVPAGGPCTVGQGACAADGLRICGENGALICDAVPGEGTDELCNAIDDDCDGTVDESFELGEPCSAGIGACAVNGLRVCDDAGGARCDATAGEPDSESCNGLDDDCDGTADEGYPLGETCTVGVGACAATGARVCNGRGTTCDAMAGRPSQEICNGIDDDCSGVIDEGFDLGQRCLEGVGACAADGQRVCDDAGGAICDAAPGAPSEEVCNGADDDCDGAADEVDGLGEPCTAGLGACRAAGTFACDLEAQALTCIARAGIPTPETCDGVDEDCDGAIDEDVPRCDVGCDAVDDDDDGRSDEGCAIVSCGPAAVTVPPCNGAPDGTELEPGWVYVPAGEFVAGDLLCAPDADPRDGRRVLGLSRGVVMQATEVTRAEWQAVAGVGAEGAWPSAGSSADQPGGVRCDTCPVDSVSWLDAAWYANALSIRDGLTPCYAEDVFEADGPGGCRGTPGTGCAAAEPYIAVDGEGPAPCGCGPGDDRCGRAPPADLLACPPAALARLGEPRPECDGYRLPSEAEWTRAARAGTTPPPAVDEPFDAGCVCFGDQSRCPALWWDLDPDGPTPEACRDGGPSPGRRGVTVGRSNPYGLYGMVGNVAEWTQDAVDPAATAPDDPRLAVIDPVGPPALDARVVRGVDEAAECRTSARGAAAARFRSPGIGFRLVRDVAAGTPFRVTALTDAGPTAGGQSFRATVAHPQGFAVSGALWLAHDGAATRLADFVEDGPGFTVVLDLEALARVVPTGPEGSGPHRFVARFDDGAGRHSSFELRWWDGCDAADDGSRGPDGAPQVALDGTAADSACRSVLCGEAAQAIPPCNGAPAGTEVPHGWVYVPPGDFTMGSDDPADADTDWFPAQPTRVSRGFLMHETEVTRAQWAAAIAARWRAAAGAGDAPSEVPTFDAAPACDDRDRDDDCPVQRVNWWEALWLANVLSEEAGFEPCYDPATLRACAGLPENAALIGTGDPAAQFACLGNRDNRALLWPQYEPTPLDPAATCDGFRLPSEAEWVRADRLGETVREAEPPINHPVRARPPNLLGLYGMGGNVFEWMADSTGAFFDLGVPLVDPVGPEASRALVMRGRGGVTVRTASGPERRHGNTGLRLVRTVSPAAAVPQRAQISQAGGFQVTPAAPARIQVQLAGVQGPMQGQLVVEPNGSGPSVARPLVDEGEGEFTADLDWALARQAMLGRRFCGATEFYMTVRFVDIEAGATSAKRIPFTARCEFEGEPGLFCDDLCRPAPDGCDPLPDVCPEAPQ